jgi:hypothetical protein
MFAMQNSRRYTPIHARQVEGEGIVRMLLLALAVAMPLATMAYLQVQQARLSYAMSDNRARISHEEETQRQLLLERSRFQRDEEIQSFATGAGLQPRKQGHLVPRSYTREDQRLAKLNPAPANGL